MSFLLPPRTITFSPATASAPLCVGRAEAGGLTPAGLTPSTQQTRADRAERLGVVAAPIAHVATTTGETQHDRP